MGVLVALLGGQPQPVDGLSLILGNVLSQQICLAQRVLGKLIPVLRALREQFQRPLHVLGHCFGAEEQELAQLILCQHIAAFGSLFEPG